MNKNKFNKTIKFIKNIKKTIIFIIYYISINKTIIIFNSKIIISLLKIIFKNNSIILTKKN